MEKAASASAHLCSGILLFDFIALHGIFVYKKTDSILAVHADYGNCDNLLFLACKWIYALFFACCTIFAIDARVVLHRKRKFITLSLLFLQRWKKIYTFEMRVCRWIRLQF